MLRFILAGALACSVVGNVQAADLARQTRLGAIFAEPAAPRLSTDRTDAPFLVYAPEVDIPPLVNGYYGKPNSYLYKSYYGTSPVEIFSRLPYACGFYGYC